MIADSSALADIRVDWQGVRRMQQEMTMLCNAASMGSRGRLAPMQLRHAVQNLPMLLAFDVLRTTLRQLRREGHFHCAGRDLGPLMDASETALTWLDWHALREGVGRRNAIAHDGALFESKQCWGDIDAIQAQLVAWGVLDA